MYAKADIELIRSKVDILTFLEARGIQFRQSGTRFMGLCPIHNERSPSFNVNPMTNTYHCFGCGSGGDIFSLVQAMDQLSFTGAIQELAEYANVDIQNAEEDEDFKAKQRLFQICDLAAVWFRQNFLALPDEHPAKQNLAARDLLYPRENSGYNYSAGTDKTIGYAPREGLIKLLLQQKFSLEEIKTAGLAKTHEETNVTREQFRNRLIWTVTDIQGRPIGFSGRKLSDDDLGPKYLNSPQTPLYNKSKTLLGLAAAKKEIVTKQEVYVVEGQTDVMALRAIGVNNVVATCGTAFGTDHASMLSHLSSIGKESEHFRIIFCFDGDAAGVKAAKSVFEKNKSIQLNSFVVKLDGEAGDPCDLRLHFGDDALREALATKQVSIIEFILKEEIKLWKVTTPEGQSGYIRKAKEILSLISDPIQYSSYLRKVSFWTGISYDEISATVRQNNRNVAIDESQRAVAEANQIDNMEIKFLAAYLQYPKEISPLLEKFSITLEFFVDHRELAETIFSQIELDEINYNDPQISRLLHLDIKVAEERKDAILLSLVKSFLKALYSNELNKVNARMTQLTPESDEGLLEEIMMEQFKLKQKYSI